jgi:CTP synthase (UTP-ammonia lyase)
VERTVNIGIIGDYDVNKMSHAATMDAIEHAVRRLNIKAKAVWLPTPSFLARDCRKILEPYDAVWASSGSPYLSMEGAIAAIKATREMRRPFIGT